MLFNPLSSGFRSYSAGLTGVRSGTMWCRVGGDGGGYGSRAVGFGRLKTEEFEEDAKQQSHSGMANEKTVTIPPVRKVQDQGKAAATLLYKSIMKKPV